MHVAAWPQILSYNADASNLIDVAGKAVPQAVGSHVMNSVAVVSEAESEAYSVDEEINELLRSQQGRQAKGEYIWAWWVGDCNG